MGSDGDPEEWPPRFSLDMNDRQRLIVNCYTLMERLMDEYGGRGRVKWVAEDKIAVEIVYDLPVTEGDDAEGE